MVFLGSDSAEKFTCALEDLKDALGFDEDEFSYVDRCIESPREVRDKIRSL